MPVLNVPMLNTVMKHIEDNPLAWDQGTWTRNLRSSLESRKYNGGAWLRSRGLSVGMIDEKLDEIAKGEESCNTAGCAAGWAVLLSDQFNLNKQKGEDSWDRVAFKGELGDQTVHIRDAARIVLGFTQRQAYEFFDASNSLEHLKVLAKQYKKEAKAAAKK